MSRTDSTPFSAVLTWAGIALLAYLLYRVVEPFLVPLGWACVLAVLLAPVQRRLTARYSAGRAAALCTTGATLILILPAVVLVTAFAREMVDLAQSLQATLAQGNTSTLLRGWDEVVRRVPFAARIDMDSLAPDLLRRAATTLMSQSGGIVTNIAVFFVDLALALFATFFLLRDAAAIMRAVASAMAGPSSRTTQTSHGKFSS